MSVEICHRYGDNLVLEATENVRELLVDDLRNLSRDYLTQLLVNMYLTGTSDHDEEEDESDSKQLSKSNSKLDVLISRLIQEVFAQMFVQSQILKKVQLLKMELSLLDLLSLGLTVNLEAKSAKLKDTLKQWGEGVLAGVSQEILVTSITNVSEPLSTPSKSIAITTQLMKGVVIGQKKSALMSLPLVMHDLGVSCFVIIPDLKMKKAGICKLLIKFYSERSQPQHLVWSVKRVVDETRVGTEGWNEDSMINYKFQVLKGTTLEKLDFTCDDLPLINLHDWIILMNKLHSKNSEKY
ncbi:hypothetical protein LXL04_008047 [Taraxacum kok-saghyz]